MKDQQSSLELKPLVVYCALIERAGTKQVCRPWLLKLTSHVLSCVLDGAWPPPDAMPLHLKLRFKVVCTTYDLCASAAPSGNRFSVSVGRSSEGQSQQMNAQGSAVTPGALSAALRGSLQLGRAHLERRPN